jgi:hypothetical protein
VYVHGLLSTHSHTHTLTYRVLYEVKDHDEPVMALDSYTYTSDKTSDNRTSVVTGGAGSELCLHRDFKCASSDVQSEKTKKLLSIKLRKPGTHSLTHSLTHSRHHLLCTVW